MDFFEVKLKMKWFKAAFILLVISGHSIEVNAVPQPEYIIEGAVSDDLRPDIVFLQHIRHKRDAPAPTAVVTNGTAPTQPALAPAPPALAPAPTDATTVTTPVSKAAAVATTNATATQAPANATEDSNRTTKLAKASTPVAAGVTQVPILGKDGAGQRWPNHTDTTPKVSDPISPDNYFTDVFETPERIKAEQNLESLKYDNHTFYNSTFIGNASYFAEYWANISAAPAQTHDMLSNSHRKATTVKLSFMFPFYGHWIQTITVATGGFIYTGEHTHSWLAATQYIAPLMGNFDTSLDNSSRITMTDTGDHFTVFWERVTLREERDKPFTFAATLRKNGDIEFAYQQVPIPVHLIDDTAHPVKIGISDAYLTDKIIFYVRRKTVYEYHRVSFKNHEISNGTVLRLTALPTCLQYDSCDACLNHNTTFQCAWCENIQKCSSGTDRNKQDWQLRNCDNTLVSNATSCPAAPATAAAAAGNSSGPHTGGPYVTDGVAHHDADVRTLNSSVSSSAVAAAGAGAGAGAGAAGYRAGAEAGAARGGGAVGGAVAACACVALVCALAAWALYAFRNPHTRSGQLFIKYRPSQWNWRRGEARYTAATIHM